MPRKVPLARKRSRYQSTSGIVCKGRYLDVVIVVVKRGCQCGVPQVGVPGCGYRGCGCRLSIVVVVVVVVVVVFVVVVVR